MVENFTIIGTSSSRTESRQIAIWLLICCAVVFAMVVLGGLTRLTHSGLSMVDWKPLTGWLPPLSSEAWQLEFENYQRFPEYQKLNQGMTLAEFKSIFWFEFSHRLLGRGIGVLFFVPFLYFLLSRKIDRGLLPKLLFMFVLGGLQGVLGWWMVKSGLLERPDVSHYRLTAHLGLAVLIFGYMLSVAVTLLVPKAVIVDDRLRGLGRFGLVMTLVVFVVILSGGLVAGLDAGFAYNTFPLMDGRLVPEGLFDHAPWYINPLENLITIQFDHRWLAVATLLAVVALWQHALRRGVTGSLRTAFHLVLVVAAIQVGLGIATLVLVVPVALAALHQAGALLLFSVIVIAAQLTRQAAG
ncbi:MAG: COX15/CtaA family protein [Alphaproteobacteria bacterium]|nr:COX15/CtaA family protein [Alphaproteobacteria bacterium]MDP6624740.1 COX15/CtaA family protein [Alphaproteobacteria bacterium]